MFEQTGEYCHGESVADLDEFELNSSLSMEGSSEDLLG